MIEFFKGNTEISFLHYKKVKGMKKQHMTESFGRILHLAMNKYYQGQNFQTNYTK